MQCCSRNLQKRLVSIECGGSAHLLSEDVRPQNATTPGTALAACPGTYPVPAMRAGLPLYDRHSATVYLADTLSLSTNVAARCRLSSAESRTLQLPSTRRTGTTLGDRAFSVAAVRPWNSLPPEIRNSDSLLTFRRMTNTYLFQLSF